MEFSSGGQFVVPDVVVTHFHLNQGDLVADFGAGSGFFVGALSQAVGESGRVYACEIQKELVEKLGNQARANGHLNVSPLWCDIEEPNGIKIADEELDAGAVVNTLFMLEDKDTAVKEMARTIRKGGKVFVIDWSESYAGMGPHADQVISAEDVADLFEDNGFVLENDFPAGGHHYGLAFRKV